jgi:hypothetical protein
MWLPTGWRFVTSEGLDISGGAVIYNLTASGGSFFVAHTDGQRLALRYCMGQAGGGLGLPLSFDYSHARFPSSGTEIRGFNRRSLRSRDFEGNFRVLSLQGGDLGGGQILWVEFNFDFTDGHGVACGRIASSSVGIQLGFSGNIGIGRVLFASLSGP